MMFADGIALIGEHLEYVKNTLEEWKVAREGKRLKISRSATRKQLPKNSGRNLVVLCKNHGPNSIVAMDIFFLSDLSMNMAIKDSIGGWKENAFFLRQPKLCTAFKNLMGSALPKEFRKNIDYKGDCPIPPGVYFSSGFDVTSYVANSNVPKQFFYGTYKTRIASYDKRNNEMSCINLIMDIKRPWETL
ncbi:Hypothetical protein CINCED_3A018611 [Cinara cedri]|uniref:Uncharacterized protein n=1 Tax=Cinara cedri TaxID=506608 RepID=A0A5E4LYH7_9HEMI|nr:Hypothetical protein CINCED_3A018611 [Cinara cedri]